MHLTEKDLAARLDAAGVPFELLHASEETPSVEAAARAFGIEPDAIVKSLLFADRDAPDRFVLVLARGLSRVDLKKLALAHPGRWRFATPEEVVRVTGYAAGEVPPVAHASRLDVVMDARVGELVTLVGGGAGPRVSLRVACADVARLTGAQVADVAR